MPSLLSNTARYHSSLKSNDHLKSIWLPFDIYASSLRLPSDVHLTSFWLPSNLCPTYTHRPSSVSTHCVLQTVCSVRTLWLVLCIATKFWGMGQHHVLGWWEHYCSTKAKVLATKKHIMIWVDFFELTIFTMVPSSIYNAIVIQDNSYQELKLRLQYINRRG
jgi:hypothetical protein